MSVTPLPSRPAADPLLTAQDVAERFNVPVSWVYSRAESGKLPSFKVGHYRRFRESEIAEYLEGCRQGPAARNGHGR